MYYMRERQSLQTWRHVACWKLALRRMAKLVATRRRRRLLLLCLGAFGLTENDSNSSLSEPQTQFSHRQGSGVDSEDDGDEVSPQTRTQIVSPVLFVAEGGFRGASAEPVTQLSSRSGGGMGAGARGIAGLDGGHDRSPAASPSSAAVQSAYFAAHPYYLPWGVES